jgi:hypothetical protein
LASRELNIATETGAAALSAPRLYGTVEKFWDHGQQSRRVLRRCRVTNLVGTDHHFSGLGA